jgi:hypothetical protein
MTLDWYSAIRECSAYWPDAAMLQQTFEALEKNFVEENDACIDCAKSIVGVVCRLIVDELDDPTRPAKPAEEIPSFGAWVSAAVRTLKLGDIRNNASASIQPYSVSAYVARAPRRITVSSPHSTASKARLTPARKLHSSE